MRKKLTNQSNLVQRVVAAVIGAPFIIFCIIYNQYTCWLLFTALAILSQYEFYKLLGLNGNFPLTVYGTFCGAVITSLVFFVETNQTPFDFYYLMVPLLTLTFFIKLYKKNDSRPFENLGYTFLGIIYVALPIALVLEMVLQDDGFKPFMAIGILIILWVNDSGAYFAGRTFGKRKLFERISPKKTWEGFFGGAICALVAAFFYSKYSGLLDLTQWMSIACIIVITGTLGDLVESLFKRSIEIKDSGSIIPGHGGFLDRFDGLFLSMPFIITFLKLYHY